jgi:hypothetical protein
MNTAISIPAILASWIAVRFRNIGMEILGSQALL